MNPWDTARNWVRARLIYPQNHPQMGWILNHMSKVKIKKADVLPKGTQLKMLLYLEGNQKESVLIQHIQIFPLDCHSKRYFWIETFSKSFSMFL